MKHYLNEGVLFYRTGITKENLKGNGWSALINVIFLIYKTYFVMIYAKRQVSFIVLKRLTQKSSGFKYLSFRPAPMKNPVTPKTDPGYRNLKKQVSLFLPNPNYGRFL